jgi:hypothetical protein
MPISKNGSDIAATLPLAREFIGVGVDKANVIDPFTSVTDATATTVLESAFKKLLEEKMFSGSRKRASKKVLPPFSSSDAEPNRPPVALQNTQQADYVEHK